MCVGGRWQPGLVETGAVGAELYIRSRQTEMKLSERGRPTADPSALEVLLPIVCSP
jgi:hypothetical protein